MFLARKVQHGSLGGEVPITSPNHPDLVAMYTMDNISGSTLVDESPNSNDATIAGATSVSGKINNALSFDGTNDDVDMPFTLSGRQEVTVCFWMKPESASTGNFLQCVFREPTSESGSNFFRLEFSFQESSQKIRAAWRDSNSGESGAGKEALSDSTVSYDAYNFAAIVLSATANLGTLYVGDTAQADTETFSGFSSTTSIHNPLLCARKVVNLTNWSGDIDQLRVFDKALSASEISALYNGGTGA